MRNSVLAVVLCGWLVGCAVQLNDEGGTDSYWQQLLVDGGFQFADAGAASPDAGPNLVILEGDIVSRPSCAEVCSARARTCMPDYTWSSAPFTSGGYAIYGSPAIYVPLNCANPPAVSYTDPATHSAHELLRYYCACGLPLNG